jgi:hypothetical protein
MLSEQNNSWTVVLRSRGHVRRDVREAPDAATAARDAIRFSSVAACRAGVEVEVFPSGPLAGTWRARYENPDARFPNLGELLIVEGSRK